MNEKQEWLLGRLKDDIFNHDSHGDGYEYKECEVKEQDGIVFLKTQVGLKGDEGTMGELFARTHRHIAIWGDGQIRLLNAADLRDKKHHKPRKNSPKGRWNAIHLVTTN